MRDNLFDSQPPHAMIYTHLMVFSRSLNLKWLLENNKTEKRQKKVK